MKNVEDTAGEIHHTLEIQNLEQALKELRIQLSDRTSQIESYEKVCDRNIHLAECLLCSSIVLVLKSCLSQQELVSFYLGQQSGLPPNIFPGK